jgi:hypothetical protein
MVLTKTLLVNYKNFKFIIIKLLFSFHGLIFPALKISIGFNYL